MNQAEQVMPAVLRELHTLEFHYADGEGIDFEPYSAFAERHSGTPHLGSWEVVARAQTEFPSFAREIRAICR